MSHEEQFSELLKEIETIHNSKKADYSELENRFSNFEYSDYVAKPFPDKYKSFAVLIGTKLARLAVLLKAEEKGVKPNNESIDDTMKDLPTYTVIMWHYYRHLRRLAESNLVTHTHKATISEVLSLQYPNIEGDQRKNDDSSVHSRKRSNRNSSNGNRRSSRISRGPKGGNTSRSKRKRGGRTVAGIRIRVRRS